MAIQKLVSVRNAAIQDCEPCWVLDGLYLGTLLTLHALVFGSVWSCNRRVASAPSSLALPHASTYYV